MSIETMAATHPDAHGGIHAAVLHAVERAAYSAQICTLCADACLAEPESDELVQCIRLDLDCADLCRAVLTIGLRRTGSNGLVLRRLFETCAEECGRHARHHEHCRLCAEACVACARACLEAAAAVSP